MQFEEVVVVSYLTFKIDVSAGELCRHIYRERSALEKRTGSI